MGAKVVQATIWFGFMGVALVAGSVQAQAETHTYEEANIKIDTPDHWKAQKGERNFSALSPDYRAVLLFRTKDTKNLQMELFQTMETLDKKTEGIRFGEPEVYHNNHGMSGLLMEGQGIKNGNKLYLGIVVVQLPHGKSLFVTLFHPADQTELQTAGRAVIDSIRPASVGKPSKPSKPSKAL